MFPYVPDDVKDVSSTSSSPQDRGEGQDEVLHLDQINLASFPLTLLDRRPRASGDDQRHTFRITEHLEGGGTIERQWTLVGNLPIAGDEEVWLALLSVARDQGLRENRVEFTLTELAERMGIGIGGAQTKRVYDALLRLGGFKIEAQESVMDFRSESYLRGGTMNVVDVQVTTRQGVTTPCSATFGEALWKQMREGGLKPLNIGTYLALPTQTAKKLYRYLDVLSFSGEREATIDTVELAQRIGSTNIADRGQIARQLRPALEELQASGFLEAWEITPRSRSVYVRFAPNHTVVSARIEQLVKLGVRPWVARDMVMRFKWSEIERHLPAAKKSRSAPAFLVAAVGGDYKYKPKREPTAKQKAPLQQGLFEEARPELAGDDLRARFAEDEVAAIESEVEAELQARPMTASLMVTNHASYLRRVEAAVEGRLRTLLEVRESQRESEIS